MFSLYEQYPEFHEWNNRSKEILSQLMAGARPLRQQVTFPANYTFYDRGETEMPLVFIREGFLRCERDGQLLFFVEAGDLIGWSSHFLSDLRIIAECEIVADEFSRADFTAAVQRVPERLNLWNSYIEYQFRLYIQLLAQFARQEQALQPRRRYFNRGDAIIIQETTPVEVYTMMYGTADVFTNGVKVGEIHAGEIFGAMSATTNTNRSASVIARTSCVVSALPKDNFLHLIRTHPGTVFKLIEDMSRIIVSQNERIVELTQGDERIL